MPGDTSLTGLGEHLHPLSSLRPRLNRGPPGGWVLPSTPSPCCLSPSCPAAAVGAAVGHCPGAAVPAPCHPSGRGDREGPGRDLLPLLPQGEQPWGVTARDPVLGLVTVLAGLERSRKMLKDQQGLLKVPPKPR